MGTLVLICTIAAPADAHSEQASLPPLPEPRITFLDQPTPKERAIVMWAVDRFHDAGLQLPDLQVAFPNDCAGKAGLYFVGRRYVEFCNISERIAVHEFAHAWDDTSGAVDRAAFLELRGLSVWYGGTTIPWQEQGAEHLAHIVAWGLMNVGKRSTHGLPHNSDAELTAAFNMLTDGSRRAREMKQQEWDVPSGVEVGVNTEAGSASAGGSASGYAP